VGQNDLVVAQAKERELTQPLRAPVRTDLCRGIGREIFDGDRFELDGLFGRDGVAVIIAGAEHEQQREHTSGRQ